MRTSSRILWNAVSKWLATIANAGMTLLLVPFLLIKLGTEGFGLSALVSVIVSLSAVADLGLQAALTRQLSAELHRKDARRYEELYASAMSLYIIIALTVGCLCVIFAMPMARLFNVSEELMPQAVFIIRYYSSLAVFLSLIRPAYASVLASHDRFDLLNHAGTAVNIIRGVLLLAVLGFSNTGLYGWAAVCFACSLLELLMLRHLARRLRPGLKVRPGLVRGSAVTCLFSMGGYFTLIKIIGMLGVHSDPIVLTTYLGPAAVALYRPPGQLSGLARAFVLAMSQQLHPLATKYHVTGDRAALHAVLIRGTRFTFLIGIGACGFLMIFAEPVMAIWLGKELGQQYMVAAWLLVLFAVSDLCEYAGGSQGPIMVGMNLLRFPTLMNLPLAAANLVGSILLVKYSSLGAVGVLVPTVVCFAIRRVIETVYMASVTGMGLMRYLRGAYAWPMVVLAIMLAGGGTLRAFWRPGNIPQLALAAVGTMVVWVMLCWWIGFGPEDRRSFRGLVAKLRSRGTSAVKPAQETVTVEE